MDTTILQVPIKKKLRDKAAKAATEAGFSSLQEAVRVFLTLFASGQLKLVFQLDKQASSTKKQTLNQFFPRYRQS